MCTLPSHFDLTVRSPSRADQHPVAREASAYPPLAPTTREAQKLNATDMFCSSKLKTTPRGGESPPSRGGKAAAVPPGASGVDQALADKLLKISVRGAPSSRHEPNSRSAPLAREASA